MHMCKSSLPELCQKVQAKTRHSITDKGIEGVVGMHLPAVPPGQQTCLQQYLENGSFKCTLIGSANGLKYTRESEKVQAR